MPTLNWIGKDAVVDHHKQVPFRLLKCSEKLSAPPLPAGEGRGEGGGNLLIQGDNLEALKALLPYYAGQVKCIYIDPPYNTGNEGWVYNDNVNSPEMKEWLGRVVGGEAEDLSRHDKWLSMMYPRIILLRELLAENGAIFVSIDDNEVSNLRAIMDEIFGKENFVSTIVWQKVYTVKNSAKYLSDMHDYVVLYAKKKSTWERNLRPRSEDTDEDYDNPDDDPNGPWISHALQSRNKYSKGIYSIKSPNGRVIKGPPPGTYWRLSEQNFWKADKKGEVWWGKDGNAFPRIKEYLKDAKQGVVPSTWWSHKYAGTNSGAKIALRRTVGDQQMFITPKPIELVQRILELATDKDSLILDSFSGSGATGHAVLKQNIEDGGNRRFILVEMDTNIAQNITAERLKRVVQGYEWKDQKGKTRKEEGLGGGFRYCELGATLFDANGQIREEVSYNDLAQHVYFVETGQPLTPNSSPKSGRGGRETPLLGVHNGTAIYLLYNGILKDKRAKGGNVLTRAMLRSLPPSIPPKGGTDVTQKIIYGTGCLLSEEKLRELGITFRQIPYEVKAS
jgi:site-specific DNA-methyltransferase (adenine-specific)/adenine-specific DNA-methyltransferase